MHIYKYVLPIENFRPLVEMPEDAEIIHVAMQHDRPTVWAKVDTHRQKAVRAFTIVGTGAAIPEGGTYIGTCFDGPFVWHVFEEPVGVLSADQ